MEQSLRRYALIGVLTVLLGAVALPVGAETLRVGTPAGNNFTFLPLRVGMHRGFFTKYGLDIEAVDFQGGSKLQQAMVAGALDLAVSGGTDIAYIAKGVPEMT